MRAKALKQYSLDESIPYLMNRVVGRQNRRLEADLRKLHLSFQHWRLLAVLARSDGASIAQLSDYAVVPHSTLSRLLTRLERASLVKRSARTPDGRTARILLTPRGRSLYKRILPLAVDRREDAMAGFSETEKNTLRTMLKRMLGNLETRGECGVGMKTLTATCTSPALPPQRASRKSPGKSASLP